MEISGPYSDSYVVVARMIRQGEIMFSELEHLLNMLEGQEHITTEERKALLELARELNIDSMPSP